jgi:hypothetical protein
MSDSGRGLFRGCYWGEQTWFAVLDIDATSKYHNAQELKQLRQRLVSIGLSGNLLFQSSDSGGWHLYIPFTDLAASKEVEQALKAWLKSQGYDTRGGQLEVFPCGNGLRLPLQPGFAWLAPDGSLIRRREEMVLEAALSSFLSDFKNNANDWSYAKALIESQISAADRAAGSDAQALQKRLDIDGLDHVFGGKIPEIWEKGRKWWQKGLASKGERHDAVLAVGHYLWYGDSKNGVAALPGARNDEYRAKLIEHWLTQKHNGFCRHIDQNKWEEITAQIKRAVLWRGNAQAKEYEPYRVTDRLLKRLIALYRKTGKLWTVEEFEKANHDRRLEARARIAEAIINLEDQGRLITIAEVARQAGAHWSTVKKNADLLTPSLGEYNRGGGGGLGALLPFPYSEFEEENESPDSDLELESVSGAGCVLDSLRYDRTGQTATNSRQVTTEVLAAVHPIQSNSGVKHELAGFAPSVASGGIACGINGFLPTASQQVPSIYSSAVFSIGAPAQNLRQVGNRCDGLMYKPDAATSWDFGLSATAQVQQVDNSITLVLPLERAFGYVPLSCYVRSLAESGRLLSSEGYMVLGAEAHVMSNESHEKPEQEGPAEQQAEHVKRAQGEATNATESYTEQVKAHRIEKKLSGNSGATGQLPDKDGKGLASAKDLLGDDAHGLSKSEKQAALLAQIERDGYIVGKAQDKPVLIAQASENRTNETWLERKEQREKNYHNDVAEQLKDALYTPRDGQTWKLSDFLSRAHSPIMEAYELSKHLEEGQPGKSKTLEAVVDRLKTCPWADQIRIKFDKNAHNPEYDNGASTITIKPQEPDWQQIDTFAHEAFHATHQTLKELYMGKEPMSFQDYLQVKADAEISSFETEVKVHRELNLPGRVTYVWQNSQKHQQEPMDLGELYSKEGRSGLAKFLMFDAHTEMLIQGQKQISNYHHYHESTYDDYLKGFQTAKKSLEKMFEHDPAKEKNIVEGHY